MTSVVSISIILPMHVFVFVLPCSLKFAIGVFSFGYITKGNEAPYKQVLLFVFVYDACVSIDDLFLCQNCCPT